MLSNSTTSPTRVEVRYHLARLRMDQGLRSDATSAFVDYLEHAQPADDEAADALEQRCVEIVESFPDLAPLGQIVEKLETIKRPQGAYKIVQRAADHGDQHDDGGELLSVHLFTRSAGPFPRAGRRRPGRPRHSARRIPAS